MTTGCKSFVTGSTITKKEEMRPPITSTSSVRSEVKFIVPESRTSTSPRKYAEAMSAKTGDPSQAKSDCQF